MYKQTSGDYIKKGIDLSWDPRSTTFCRHYMNAYSMAIVNTILLMIKPYEFLNDYMDYYGNQKDYPFFNSFDVTPRMNAIVQSY